jgi:hypothetical protein
LSEEIKEGEISRRHVAKMQKRNAYVRKRIIGIDGGIKLK